MTTTRKFWTFAMGLFVGLSMVTQVRDGLVFLASTGRVVLSASQPTSSAPAPAAPAPAEPVEPVEEEAKEPAHTTTPRVKARRAAYRTRQRRAPSHARAATPPLVLPVQTTPEGAPPRDRADTNPEESVGSPEPTSERTPPAEPTPTMQILD